MPQHKNARGSVSRVLSGWRTTLCDHSSRDVVTNALKQSTRTTGRRMPCAVPIRSCFRWGLPCQRCCQCCGALLPHRFDLTAPKQRRFVFCGTFPCVAAAGGYPAPFLAEARTFLPCVNAAAVAQPSGRSALAGSAIDGNRAFDLGTKNEFRPLHH